MTEQGPEQLNIEKLTEVEGKEETSADLDTQELDEKVLEKAMEKVQDINQEGTAYSVVINSDPNRLENIFKNGLLGTNHTDVSGVGNKVSVQDWVENMRDERKGTVYFNIVGKSELTTEDNNKYNLEIAKSYYIKSGDDRIAILFDLSKFKQEAPINLDDRYSFKQKTRTYRADKPLLDEESNVIDQFGYLLSFRVAPRNFTGIVFRLTRELTEKEFQQELKEELKDRVLEGEKLETFKNYLKKIRFKEQKDPIKLSKRADEILSIMKEAYKGKENLMLPIYDTDGNLYWPQKIQYKDLKGRVSKE